MRDLVEYIIKQLVTKPDAVVVEEQVDGTAIQLYLTVDPEDMGLVIGKSGQTIKSIRKLLTVKAMADNVHVNLTLNEQAPSAGSEQALPSGNDQAPVSDSEQAPSAGSEQEPEGSEKSPVSDSEQSGEEAVDQENNDNSNDVIPSEVEESSTSETEEPETTPSTETAEKTEDKA